MISQRQNRLGWVVLSALFAWSCAPATAAKVELTVQDYIEIQQLYSRFGWALDSNAENGQALANCFTPDAVWSIAGRPDLVGRHAIATFGTQTFNNSNGAIRHWFTNLVITPTAQGATGAVYVLVGRVAQDAAPATVTGTAMYRSDVLVKTAEGWRFKRRKAEFPA